MPFSPLTDARQSALNAPLKRHGILGIGTDLLRCVMDTSVTRDGALDRLTMFEQEASAACWPSGSAPRVAFLWDTVAARGQGCPSR